MDPRCRHFLVEYHGCDAAVLDDLHRVRALMVRAADAAQTHIVTAVFHPFAPQGVSGVVVIEESHLSIHTWPEHGYASVDFFTGGDAIPERAHEVLRDGLGAMRSEILIVDRGMLGQTPSMRIRTHHESARAETAEAMPSDA